MLKNPPRQSLYFRQLRGGLNKKYLSLRNASSLLPKAMYNLPGVRRQPRNRGQLALRDLHCKAADKWYMSESLDGSVHEYLTRWSGSSADVCRRVAKLVSDP